MKTISELYDLWSAKEREIEATINQLAVDGVTGDDAGQAIKAKYGPRPNYWHDVIAQGLANDLKKAGNFGRVDVLGPMGIGARVSLHCFDRNDTELENCKSITFEPNLSPADGQSVLYRIDYSQDSGKFARGTLGHANGMNYGQEPLDNDLTAKELLGLLDE